MENLRVIDHVGNKQDYQTEFVPRIGERIVLEWKASGAAAAKPHYYRVKDVAYHLDRDPKLQVTILIADDADTAPWPS
jgi:hypothetical protein